MNSMVCSAQDVLNTLREEHLTQKNIDEETMKLGEKILEMSGVFGDDNNIFPSATDKENSIGEEKEIISADEEEEAIKALLNVNDEVLKLGEQEPLKRVNSGESPSLKQEGENEEEEKAESNFLRRSSTGNDDHCDKASTSSSPSIREMRAKFFASSSSSTDSNTDTDRHN